MHEAAEASLPSPLSVLVPASEVEAIAHAAVLVQRVMERRDTGGDSAAAVFDVELPERSGYDPAERASWKIMQAARWSAGGAKMAAEARAQQKAQMKQMRTGPARNKRAELRLMQAVARANCVNCTPKAPLRMAAPPHWPFVWDYAIQLAGAVVETLVAAVAARVPRARWLGLCARRVQLGHRLTLLTERELEQLMQPCYSDGETHEGQKGRTQCLDGPQLLSMSAAALGGALEGSNGPRASADLCTVKPSTVPIDQEESDERAMDCAISGALRVAPPKLLHQVEIVWPAAAAWRRSLGLAESPEQSGFFVELGM